MLFNPGSDRPRGPWGPDGKKKYFDTTYVWWLLPLVFVAS